jgi:2'-5' RNA ligase
VRLFVALNLPEEHLDDLTAAVEPVRRSHPDLRWAPPHRWHLTLAFLGEVGEGKLPELEARLQRAAARCPPLGLAVAGAGRFGRQVLWVGVTGDTEPLRRLAGAVAAAARRCGIDVGERSYHPHVTVARARTPTDLRAAAAALSSYAGAPWTAEAVELMRSRLGPTPSYEPLLSAVLGKQVPPRDRTDHRFRSWRPGNGHADP